MSKGCWRWRAERVIIGSARLRSGETRPFGLVAGQAKAQPARSALEYPRPYMGAGEPRLRGMRIAGVIEPK
jgi:hypothetical protein